MDNGPLVEELGDYPLTAVEELKAILRLNLSGRHAQVTLRLLALLAKLQENKEDDPEASDLD